MSPKNKPPDEFFNSPGGFVFVELFLIRGEPLTLPDMLPAGNK